MLTQATETVKLILGVGEPLVGRLRLYDALAMRFRELKLRKNADCRAELPWATASMQACPRNVAD